MPTWYHRLWRLVIRAADPPPGGRRPGVRPKVEALEERQVPSNFQNLDAAPVNQGQTYTPDEILTTVAPPADRNVLLVQLTAPAEATGTLFLSVAGRRACGCR